MAFAKKHSRVILEIKLILQHSRQLKPTIAGKQNYKSLNFSEKSFSSLCDSPELNRGFICSRGLRGVRKKVPLPSRIIYCKHFSKCPLKSHMNLYTTGNCLQVNSQDQSIIRSCSSTTSTNGSSSLESQCKQQPYLPNNTSPSVSSDCMLSLHSLADLETCETPEAVLNFAVHKINHNSLHGHHIATVTDQFQKLAHAGLSLSKLSQNVHFRRKQIKIVHATDSAFEEITKLTFDSRWEQFMSFILSELDVLSLIEQVQILHSLHSLHVPNKTELFEALLQNCLAGMDLLTLKEVALVSDVCAEYENDFSTQGAIIAAIQSIMLHHPATEISLSDLCHALMNVEPVVGEDSLKLLSNIVKKKLDFDPSSITPGELLKAYQIMLASGLPYLQDLTIHSSSGMVKEKMFLEDLPLMDVSLAHFLNQPWPISYLLAKVSERCRVDVSCHSGNIDQIDFTKLSYCLHIIDAELLHSVIKKCDVFHLIQMICNHTAAGLTDKVTIQNYYNSLPKLLPDLNFKALEELLCGHNAEMMLKFLKLVCRIGIQPDKGLKEKLYTASGFDTDRAGCNTPATVGELMFQEAIETLNSNKMLSMKNFSALLSLTPRLDICGMVMLIHLMDIQPQFAIPVKKQARNLRIKIQNLFLDRLERASDLPPFLALIGSRCSPYLPALQTPKQPALFLDLISSLERFVISGNNRARNCLGSLEVLNLTSKSWPLYREELLEELTKFVVTDCPDSPMPGVHLLRALASAGHIPQDFELFINWLSPLILNILREDTVDKIFQVQMAYDMSVLGLFHDNLSCSIFSLPFLTDLHEELRARPENDRENIHQNLVLLSRSVAIECPHLAIAFLDQGKDHRYHTSKLDFLITEKVVASIKRICQSDHCVVAPSQSPYAHHIDAELILDSNYVPIPISEMSERSKASAGFKRLAVVFKGKRHFCFGVNQHFSGPIQALLRELQMLDYIVILLSHADLSSMKIHNEQALDDMIRDKINTEVGFQVFMCQDQTLL